VLISTNIDPEQEKKRIGEELTYLHGFLNSVNVKLNNEKFVANAKADVVEKEKQKRADAEQKIENLQKQLERL
jgi:valyl-tRNA synthetase